MGAKSDAHYNLAKSLLKKKIPYHGFGIQGHLVVGQLPTTIPQNVARFAALGLEVAFTGAFRFLASQENETLT